MANVIIPETVASGNIKLLRTKAGFTQEEMASKMGVARATYLKYENNPYDTDINILIAIARLLDCQVADFIVQ